MCSDEHRLHALGPFQLGTCSGEHRHHFVDPLLVPAPLQLQCRSVSLLRSHCCTNHPCDDALVDACKATTTSPPLTGARPHFQPDSPYKPHPHPHSQPEGACCWLLLCVRLLPRQVCR